MCFYLFVSETLNMFLCWEIFLNVVWLSGPPYLTNDRHPKTKSVYCSCSLSASFLHFNFNDFLLDFNFLCSQCVFSPVFPQSHALLSFPVSPFARMDVVRVVEVDSKTPKLFLLKSTSNVWLWLVLFSRTTSPELAFWKFTLLGTFCVVKLNSWNSRCRPRRYVCQCWGGGHLGCGGSLNRPRAEDDWAVHTAVKMLHPILDHCFGPFAASPSWQQ